MPTFSIVIPTKNEEQALGHLLPELKNQTLQPAEIIIADANSTDGTTKTAKLYKAQIVPGGMPGAGRNAGAAQASGDLIVFLDADVRLQRTDFLERALSEFNRRNLDIATADIEPYDSRNKLDRLGHRVYSGYVRFWGQRHPHTPGFFIIVKKSLHQQISGFDPTILFLEDHDYGYRAVKQASAQFAVLNSVKLGVTMRRFKRDGRLFVTLQNILAEVYYFIFGPIRHNLFHYNFFSYQQKKRRSG